MFERLKKRFKKPKSFSRTPAQRMVTLKRADVYYLPIAKSGSTYMKNLFYYLDHGHQHKAGDNIHSIDDALRRAKTDDVTKIRQSGYAFAVVRDPVDRFLSYYFDKIYGCGPRCFPHHREYFSRMLGLDLSDNLDAAGHRKNCSLLINWTLENLEFRTDEPINPHWRRQASRIKRTAMLDLELLTLDGLDWQLPLFLRDAVPNIHEAMAAIKARNEVAWPVSRFEVIDAALLKKIEDTYRMDVKIYRKTRQKWQAWTSEDQAPEGQLRVITAQDIPLYYVATPKVGCTYLKNLFYILEHHAPYSNPTRIHGSGAETRRDMRVGEIEKGVGFIVVRAPATRFLSLYFDKVYGTGQQAFPWIAKRLADKRGFDGNEGISLEQHQKNCSALLGFLEYRFSTQTPDQLNPHWRPQVETAKKVASFGLKPLLLEALDTQLPHIAAGRIAGLQRAMTSALQRNTTMRPYSDAEMLTPEIEQRISALYSDDQALYERVKSGWAKTGEPPEL